MTRQDEQDSRISKKKVVFPGLLIAGLAASGTVLAAATPGLWEGGFRGSNNPFYACLNVSADGQRLTAINTQCRGNQGQNQNSIDIQWDDGVTIPGGQGCSNYSYRNASFGDIQIRSDNTFYTKFENWAVTTEIWGRFTTKDGKPIVLGGARTSTQWSEACKVKWEAYPVSP